MRRKIIFLLIASFLILPASAAAVDIGNVLNTGIKGGKMIAEASKQITPSEEYYIGRSVAAMLVSKNPIYDNPGLTKYINEVGLLVAGASDRPSTYGGYHFAVLNSDIPNAYACPGGLIFVSKGLLRHIQDEDQLAAVLGHEIAHVAHNHSIKSIKKSRWTDLGFFAAGEVSKNFTPSEVSQIAGAFQDVVTDVGKKVIESGYSKADENDADLYGMIYASSAGYNPEAMIDFFKNMSAHDIGHTSGPFSSHPKTETRISKLEKNIKDLSPWQQTASVRTARFKKNLALLK